MTDNRTTDSEGDWGHTDLDPREQAEAEVNLDDPTSSADEPWSPPDRQPRGAELIGVETEEGETLSQRLSQEVPEAGTAYGAPDDHAEHEAARMLGGEDPDAIPADTDVLGDVDDDA
ncbi:MAG: hypothetical protein ACXWDL_05040 [Nocardioides sp.]